MKAITTTNVPTISAALTIPKGDLSKVNKKVTRINEPLTKLGAVVVTVDRKLVPNCSEAIVTKTTQYPVATPKKRQSM